MNLKEIFSNSVKLLIKINIIWKSGPTKHNIGLFAEFKIQIIIPVWAFIGTAWLLNLARALNWHKTEAKILLIILFYRPHSWISIYQIRKLK